jgi:ribonuclease HII
VPGIFIYNGEMSKWIIGIDEVGRGCLAGPVTVAVVAIPQTMRFKDLRDSKQFSAKQREDWFSIIKKNPKILHARANVYPRTIERINISNAANLAATRAFQKLIAHNPHLAKAKVFLDGGLFLNMDHSNAKTVIKGDEKFSAVKLASIVAKVGRDKIISRNHADYPVYGFAQHKGYGTRFHIKAIKKHGLSPLHRLTFVKNFC